MRTLIAVALGGLLGALVWAGWTAKGPALVQPGPGPKPARLVTLPPASSASEDAVGYNYFHLLSSEGLVPARPAPATPPLRP